jgi:hypothetical protein
MELILAGRGAAVRRPHAMALQRDVGIFEAMTACR